MQRDATAPLYLDIHLDAGARFEQPLPATHNAFVYVYRGELSIGERAVPVQRMALLANTPDSDGVRLQAGDAPTRALLIAGQPLGEPIAQYGPFVITAASVELRAGSRLLLDDATFRVAPGDRVGLVGRNGAGKTTLTKALAGETQPAGVSRAGPRSCGRRASPSAPAT